jgi:hypothetical protein
MRTIISLLIVSAIAGAGYYFGYMRNENICLQKIDKEIQSTKEIVDEWMQKPPAGSSITSIEAARLAFDVVKSGSAAFFIKMDPHRNICDYYFYGFELRLK